MDGFDSLLSWSLVLTVLRLALVIGVLRVSFSSQAASTRLAIIHLDNDAEASRLAIYLQHTMQGMHLQILRSSSLVYSSLSA
jgi:hypothetical protein